MENLKKQVGIEAAKFVNDGMIVGLGTGSTAKYFVEEIGRRVAEEGLNIVGVTTSNVTFDLAQSLNIPLKSIDEVEYVDLTVDGADEVDPKFNGIKGGGAALLMEKIVATYSNDCIWIVDGSKTVETLGKFPLPVEVVPYGARRLLAKFEDKGYNPQMRLSGADDYLVTDMGHYIIDLHLEKIEDSYALADELDNTVGVVEHGLFNDMISKVIVARETGVEILEK
ncbi:ribose 5-phosphate isomerase A [Floricoccus penangensis]|uniref:Ribose-5-phosphate isomerase A n=1 Tax=Floricoccus penangensis TaxID=1859475 RepID=A0A9Q5JHH5_9LACT|nr:ribose-5-phosphate isomerase RpiA [Floricoccus penangensis]OFI47618.1 ribose 5-phosphate isomerase A [Floricoccus penangensis]